MTRGVSDGDGQWSWIPAAIPAWEPRWLDAIGRLTCGASWSQLSVCDPDRPTLRARSRHALSSCSGCRIVETFRLVARPETFRLDRRRRGGLPSWLPSHVPLEMYRRRTHTAQPFGPHTGSELRGHQVSLAGDGSHRSGRLYPICTGAGSIALRRELTASPRSATARPRLVRDTAATTLTSDLVQLGAWRGRVITRRR